MKNTVRLDHESRQIVMDRTFAKLSANIRNTEYQMLQDVRRDYPDYQVVTRRIKKNHAKECYKGLTYAYMRDYITRHSGTRSKEYQTFSEMIDISKCHSDAFRYPVINLIGALEYDIETCVHVAVGSFEEIYKSGKVEKLCSDAIIQELSIRRCPPRHVDKPRCVRNDA